MDGRYRKNIKTGDLVEIVQKHHQRTGELTEGFVKRLESVIKQRHADMPSGSYTTSLFNSGVEKICKKLGEEASETIIEVVKGDKKRVVYESSDLIYHLLVLLEYCNLSFEDIENELYSRHRKD